MKEIEKNWSLLRRTKYVTNEQAFKPYNLMEFKVWEPLDQQMASLVDEDHIFTLLHMDHALLLNFAFPVANPNTAIITKVRLSE